ncbi:MAG: O-antigen ligase family protein [bacterium]|nr:O-antigen ligase family protein [bacterium]
MPQSNTLDKFIYLLGGIILISVLCVPDISLKSGWPKVQLVDFLIPVVGSTLLIKVKDIKLHAYWAIIVLFCAYIPITMHLNGRTGVIADYFEIYKLLKFSLLILFFSLLNYERFSSVWFKPIFIGLAAINLLHFFNIFNINDLLQDVYGGIHREFFGLNSLKQPATKRMIGLASSPNINAIVFSFFAIYFLPLKFDRTKIYWFLGAILLMLMCQSRTSIVALAGVLIVIAILRLSNWNLKQWGTVLASLIGLYLVSWALVTDFFSHTSYSNNVVSNSAMGRLETWAYLFEMIKESPIVGYGVNKQYFYERKLYSENEYILMQWRYGAIGLLLYLGMFFLPLWKYFQQRKEAMHLRKGFLFLLIIVTVALTNNPYQDTTIMVLTAIMLGLTWPFLKGQKQHG